MESYEWEANQSYQNVVSLLKRTHPDVDISSLPPESDLAKKLAQYKSNIEELFNNNTGTVFSFYIIVYLHPKMK